MHDPDTEEHGAEEKHGCQEAECDVGLHALALGFAGYVVPVEDGTAVEGADELLWCFC